MPLRSAIRSARLDGAPTAATIGMPARAAFCTISKPARPESTSTPSRSGSAPARSRSPIDLVHRVVAADVLAQHEQRAGRVEERRCVQTAGLREAALRRCACASGSASSTLPRDPRPPRLDQRQALHEDRLDRRLAAHAAGATSRRRSGPPRAREPRDRARSAMRATFSTPHVSAVVDRDEVARASRSGLRRRGSRRPARDRAPACAS